MYYSDSDKKKLLSILIFFIKEENLFNITTFVNLHSFLQTNVHQATDKQDK